MKKRYGWLLVLMMAAMLCCALGTALASESRTGTLTVHLANDRLGNDAGGFTVNIYRIGYPDNAWSLDAPFAGTNVLSATNGDEMEAALNQVSALVDANGTQAAGSGVSGVDGNLFFSGLRTGVYFGRMVSRNGYTMTPFVFTIPMNQNGTLTYDASVNPKMQYQATGSITLRAFKELEGRDLKAREFIFSLRTAGNRIIQRVRNDQRGNVLFSSLNYTLNGNQLTTEVRSQNGAVIYTNTVNVQGGTLNNRAIRYMIQEEPGDDDTLIYDDNVYTVEVRLTDNGQGEIDVRDNQGRTARIFRNTVRVPENGDEETVEVKEPHKLTIYYKYLLTGETAFPTYTETLWEGDPYNVPSPDLPGYFVTLRVVSGIMPDHNMEYTVYYFPLRERQRLFNIDDLETPLGLGDIQIHVGVCYE